MGLAQKLVFGEGQTRGTSVYRTDGKGFAALKKILKDQSEQEQEEILDSYAKVTDALQAKGTNPQAFLEALQVYTDRVMNLLATNHTFHLAFLGKSGALMELFNDWDLPEAVSATLRRMEALLGEAADPGISLAEIIESYAPPKQRKAKAKPKALTKQRKAKPKALTKQRKAKAKAKCASAFGRGKPEAVKTLTPSPTRP
jgi:hypothetical protein